MIEPTKQEDYLGDHKYERYSNVVSEANTHNHPYWIGAVPVPQNLLKFYNEIKHKRPDIVARVDKQPSYYNGKGYRVFAMIGLAYKDAPDLPAGRIGIEAGNVASEMVYVVESSRITNDKFASHSDGYHMKKTKMFTNAVKNAVQYIKPTSFEELRNDKQMDVHNAVLTIRNPAQDKLHQAAAMSRSTILDEVRNMVRMGYKPATQSFKNTLALLMTEDEELRRVSEYSPSKCFVWAKPDRVEYQIEGADRVVVHNLQDVPEFIRDKVSVLQIGNTGSPIMDIGVKINSTMYWLFV